MPGVGSGRTDPGFTADVIYEPSGSGSTSVHVGHIHLAVQTCASTVSSRTPTARCLPQRPSAAVRGHHIRDAELQPATAFVDSPMS